MMVYTTARFSWNTKPNFAPYFIPKARMSCPKIAKNVFKSFLRLLYYGLFDKRILAALENGKPKSLTQILSEVDFNHNTLKQHLKRRVTKSLPAKKNAIQLEKRPKYAYSIPTKLRRQFSVALSYPSIAIVSLPFSRLKLICRFEKEETANKPEKTQPRKLPSNSKSQWIKTIFDQFHNNRARLIPYGANEKRPSLGWLKNSFCKWHMSGKHIWNDVRAC